MARILIADDNAAVRRALKAVLETHADWQVCGEAANGRETVQQAAALKPDVIVLDVAMPEMDGLQAAREICSATPSLPILVYTGYAFSPEAELEAKRHGVREVINKGGSPELMIGALEDLLAAKSPGASAPAPSAVDLPQADVNPRVLPS